MSGEKLLPCDLAVGFWEITEEKVLGAHPGLLSPCPSHKLRDTQGRPCSFYILGGALFTALICFRTSERERPHPLHPQPFQHLPFSTSVFRTPSLPVPELVPLGSHLWSALPCFYQGLITSTTQILTTQRPRELPTHLLEHTCPGQVYLSVSPCPPRL